MGDAEEEGDHDDASDRDARQASGRPRGRRGRRRLRAPRHDQHDGRRRAAGAHNAGSQYIIFFLFRIHTAIFLLSLSREREIKIARLSLAMSRGIGVTALFLS